MNELVSIIVPVYNAEKYIETTIQSVLAQSYTNWELLLADDYSTDSSVQIMERIQAENPGKVIKIFQMEENIGAARTRNSALWQADGRYVSYLDADDIWRSDKLEKQIAFMEEHQAAFSFTGYEFADENGKGLGKVVQVPNTINYKQALKNTTIFTTTVMFDTERISRSELEMPVIKSEDTALWWKVLRQGIAAYGLDENLALYRRAGKSLSSNKLEALRRIWNLYRKSEHLSIPYSIYNFGFWALHAVGRRV